MDGKAAMVNDWKKKRGVQQANFLRRRVRNLSLQKTLFYPLSVVQVDRRLAALFSLFWIPASRCYPVHQCPRNAPFLRRKAGKGSNETREI